jgi:hypothetical protein
MSHQPIVPQGYAAAVMRSFPGWHPVLDVLVVLAPLERRDAGAFPRLGRGATSQSRSLAVRVPLTPRWGIPSGLQMKWLPALAIFAAKLSSVIALVNF